MLDDLGAEIARVATETERRTQGPSTLARRLLSAGPRRAPRVAVALAAAALLASGTYAVPATRAAVEGIADSLAAWVSDDSNDPPGRAVEPQDNAPKWFDEGGEARVIAQADGVALFARRVDDPAQKTNDGPWLEFGLGAGQVWGGSLESWRERLSQHTVYVLGHAPFGARDPLDERGRVPLFGVTARDVERVELRYAQGPPLESSTGDGGFVLLVDAWRRLQELIAYDATGRVLDRADVSDHDLRYLCEKEPACPPDG